jgi:hypothetical protein
MSKRNNKTDDGFDRSQRFLNLKAIYTSNKDILINIPDEYKVPNGEFKADPELLSKPINYLQVKCKGLIEMSTKIDKELEKILGHTNKLDNYISENWQPWNSNINLYFQNIKQYHNKIDIIKKKSLESTSKLILKEIKRKNIKKIRKIFLQFKKMKESISTLKVLITDVKKYKLTNELIFQNKNNIEKLKQLINKRVSLLNLFEISFDNFKTKNSSHMSGELSQILNEYFTGFAFIDESFENSYDFYKISKDNYDILRSYSYGIKHLLQHLQFKEQKDEIEKINSVCEYFIQNNLVNSIYIKLRGVFTNLANDTFNKIIDFYKKEIERKEEKEEKEEKEKSEENPENKNLIKHREKKVHYEKNKDKAKKTNINNLNNKGVSQGKNKIELKTSRIKSARTPLSLPVKVEVNKNEIESKELKQPLNQKTKNTNNKKHIKSQSTCIKEEMFASNKKEKLTTYKTPIKENNFNNKLNIKSKVIKPMEKMKTSNIFSERVVKKKKIFNKTGDFTNIQKEILLSEDTTKKTKQKIKMGIIYEQQKSTNKSKKIKDSLNINNISVDWTKKDLTPSASYNKKVNSNKLVKNVDSQKNMLNKLMLFEQKNVTNFETQNSDATFSKIDEDSILISTKKLLSYEPFDLNLAYIKPRKVLKDELISLLDKNKIKYRNISNTRFVVELKKEKISLGVKFDKLNIISEENEPNDNNFRISIIKLRKLNGIYQKNLTTFEKIINKMN